MDKVSTTIAKWFIKNNILPSEDEELYAYAIACLLMTISPLFLSLFLGGCLGLVVEGIVVIIPFVFIRTFSGGIHSNSAGICFVLSTGILFVLILLTQVISNSNILRVTMIAGAVSLAVFSPIENENKELNEKERKIYKKVTVFLLCSFFAVYIAFCCFGLDDYAVCLALGIILTAILQIPCVLFRDEQALGVKCSHCRKN